MKLIVHIADILGSVEKPRDFVTQPYLDGTDILDITKSGSNSAGWESFCMTALRNVIAAIDVHEPWASAHAARAGKYAVILARQMGLDEKDTQTAERCGLLHDIGKIGIPDGILQKPAPLTPDELEIVRKHPEIGSNLLRSFPFLSAEAMVVHAHHERYDGSGYPRRLKGAEIPLIARIVGVADSFDALKFDRAYQPAVPLDTVVKEITCQSGSLFDPDVVRAFCACSRELDSVSA